MRDRDEIEGEEKLNKDELCFSMNLNENYPRLRKELELQQKSYPNCL